MWDEEMEQEEQEKEIQELVNAFSSKKKMKKWKEKKNISSESSEQVTEPVKEKVFEKQPERKERIIITDAEVVETKERKKKASERPSNGATPKKRKPTKNKKKSGQKPNTAKKSATSNRAKIHKGFPCYVYAGFWIRMCAYIVDLLCIWGITSVILDKLIVGITNMQKDSVKTSIYGIIGTVIYLGYFILLTKITNGQTIGKMIFGLQVICFKEEKLSWSTVLIREGACRFILKTIKLFYLPTAFTKKKQHVGDVFVDTSVVTLNTIRAFQESKA